MSNNVYQFCSPSDRLFIFFSKTVLMERRNIITIVFIICSIWYMKMHYFDKCYQLKGWLTNLEFNWTIILLYCCTLKIVRKQRGMWENDNYLILFASFFFTTTTKNVQKTKINNKNICLQFFFILNVFHQALQKEFLHTPKEFWQNKHQY